MTLTQKSDLQPQKAAAHRAGSDSESVVSIKVETLIIGLAHIENSSRAGNKLMPTATLNSAHVNITLKFIFDLKNKLNR